MAELSGTFSSPFAGKLCVTLTGVFWDGTMRNAGFNSTTANMAIAGVVNGFTMNPIDRNAPVSYVEFDYPGGNVSWSISTVEIAYSFGDRVGSIAMRDLSLICRLVKK